MNDRIHELIEAGCSPAEAVDYFFVVEEGWTQTDWAKERGTTQQTVSGNVAGARKKL